MRLIGIDAGTTSVCGVLLDTEREQVERVISRDHDAALESPTAEEDIQDPDRIFSAVIEINRELMEAAAGVSGRSAPGPPVAGISLTGQMHGVLYVDGKGMACSPIYTWQDTRGRTPVPETLGSPDLSWAEWARRESGHDVPVGYGLLTHVVNRAEGKIPPEAVGLSSVLGYLSMRLTGSTVPRMEPTDAQSLGYFLPGQNAFDLEAVARVGIDAEMIPELVPTGTEIGRTAEGVPLYAAVGDNQAGFVGAVRECDRSMLVSVGTSAQLSIWVPSAAALAALAGGDGAGPGGGGTFCSAPGGLEVRPFPGEGFLLCGAVLSGGSALKLLSDLFRDICRRYAGSDPGALFDQMAAVEYDALDPDRRLRVESQFAGTRGDPQRRGSIHGIEKRNFTHDYLVEGTLRGVSRELGAYFDALPGSFRESHRAVVGVGNALRRNALFRCILSEEFHLPIVMPQSREEAALGAAIVAGVGAGAYRSCTAIERPIRYEGEESQAGETG